MENIIRKATIEFMIVIPKNYNSIKSIINAPITINGKVIGVINEVNIDKSGLYYDCKGLIWGTCLLAECYIKDDNIGLSAIIAR